MSDFLLRINGDTRCPGGINVPKNADEWSSGIFGVKRFKHGQMSKTNKTKTRLPRRGDRVYLWVIETGKDSRGKGLTAVAQVKDFAPNKHDEKAYRLETTGLSLLSNPVSVLSARGMMPEATVFKVVEGHRHEHSWKLFADELEDVKALISMSGGILSPAPTDPIEVALEDNRPEIEAALAARIQSWIKPRPGQAEFRRQSLERHGGQCVFTKTDVEEVLEAAHVIPHTGAAEFERPENNLLLRRDIHALFDLFLLSIEPDSGTILVSTQLNGSPYEELRGKSVDHKLAASALEFHHKHFCETAFKQYSTTDLEEERQA